MSNQQFAVFDIHSTLAFCWNEDIRMTVVYQEIVAF